MNRDGRRSQRGFTVLEALVAVAVLGLVAVGLVRLLGETATAAQRGEDVRLRAAIADALWQLERLGAADPGIVDTLVPEGFEWKIERRPHPEPVAAGTEDTGPVVEGLTAVAITVTDPAGRSFVLRSLVYRP